MQYHLNGYATGDPLLADPHPSVAQRSGELPEQIDVLIVGSGPAGLVLAAQLAAFPEIETAIVDRRDGPLEVGQADGVACRTVEMFEAFGLADRLVREAYWVNEVTFWQPDREDPTRITRAGRVQDTEEGLSEFPHVIVNQARMLAYLREHVERSASRSTPFYGLRASGVEIDAGGASEYPVTVTLEHSDGTAVVRAKYVVGCDGSRSAIRAAIGRELAGDATDETWGVMDILAVTDFPDIRVEVLPSPRRRATSSSSRGRADTSCGCTSSWTRPPQRRRSATERSPPSAWPRSRIGSCTSTPSSCKDVGWCSVYKIGQRLCEKFDDVPAQQMATRLAAGLHRGRCLPHAQRRRPARA